MKSKIILIISCFTLINSYSQVGIGTISPDASAALDITSTSKGFLPPRMTKAQMTAIVTPVIGLIVYCTDCSSAGLRVFDGTEWSSDFGGSVTTSSSVEVTAVSPIFSTTGKVWMDRNLGASRRAQSVNDYFAYGQFYQWGRGNDGHADMIWTSATSGVPVNGTTTSLSSTDYPENNLFITSSNDWRTSQNDNLWQGTNSVNNPCPTNYRLPSNTELSAEITAYNITNSASAFASPLKFTTPGIRNSSDGSLYFLGNYGRYWSATVSGSNANVRYFNTTNTITGNYSRASGLSVRCIKD